MDERDKDLTHLFVRDLDEIPLPPRATWRRAQGRESTAMRASRAFLTTGAIAAVLAVALIVGFQLSQRQQSAANPSASPTPSSTSLPVELRPSPTANPNATPTPAASSTAAASPIYNDDFGFVVSGGDGPPHATIRKESVNTGNATQFAPQVLAVSPDGRQIAFWAMYTATPELHLLSVSDGAERTLVTLVGDQRGGGVAWSNDSAAILYSVDTGCGICPTGPVVGATLNIYELAATGRHGTTIDAQTNTGWYRPIAWDRSANLAAAGLLGEGGGMVSYVTVRITPDNTTVVQRADTSTPGKIGSKLGILMQSVTASTDAKLVLGVDFDSSDITWWPLADFAAKKSQAGAGKRGALWRPGTHEIAFLSGEQLWLGNVDRSGAQGLCCTAFSGAPAGSTIRTFRADGTAVVLGVATANAFLADYTLVRLGTDPKATSGDRVTFQDLAGLTASVRLR